MYRHKWFLGLSLLFALLPYATAQSATIGFRWVDLKKETPVVSKVVSAIEAYPYTHLREIGVFQDAALVIVSEREKQVWSPYVLNLDLYKAINVDLKSATARQLWSGYNLHLYGVANFDSTPLPDMLFTFESCSHCEPMVMLSSFYFDVGSSAWKVRRFGAKAQEPPGVPIADAASGYDDETLTYTYAVADLDGDRQDEIGLWLREESEATHQVVDQLWIYKVTAGTSASREIRLPAERRRLQQQICNPKDSKFGNGWNSPMCRRFRPPAG